MWNVQNGGGRRRHGIVRELARFLPDVVVLTEWRATATASSSFEKLLADIGLHHQLLPDPAATHAGVLVASRAPLEEVDDGFAARDRRRWAHARLDIGGHAVDIVGVYVPSGGAGKQREKRAFLDRVIARTDELLDGPPVLLVGDFNCDHRDDTGSSSALVGEPRFEALFALGWSDLYRRLHPPGSAASWWSSHGNGYRLDHVLASAGWDAQDVRYVVGREGKTFVSTPSRKADERLSDHALLLIEARVVTNIHTAPAGVPPPTAESPVRP